MSRERAILSDRPARVGRRRYFLRMGIFYSLDVFGEDLVVEGLLRQLRQSARAHRYAIHAYCFVPHQVSLLLEGLAHSSPLRRFIRDWKQRTTLDYRKTTGMELWQRGHVDQMLSLGQCTHEVARYVVETPVRGGLVATATEHRYSGSDVSATGEALQRPAHREQVLPPDDRSHPTSPAIE